MATVAPNQSHFDGGEISPLVYGRVDSDRYKSSLALCKNWIPSLQGGLNRRPGSVYVATTKDSTQKSRLIPFNYSTLQSYMLEFGYTGGAGYIRFYAGYGTVLSSGVPYEVVHPYSASEIFQLKYTQSADVIYLNHPNHPPMKLERFGATAWQLVPVTFIDGPYLPIVNLNQTTVYSISASATSGTNVQIAIGWGLSVTGAANNGSGLIRLTVADTTSLESGNWYGVAAVVGTTEANGTWQVTVIDATHIDLQGSTFVNAYTSGGVMGLAPFVSTDVGRLIRVQSGGAWNWAKIKTFNASSTVTVQMQGTLASTTITSFALGAWSTTTGYPATVTFHEDRLVFGGPTKYPQRFDGSCVSNYENFAPTTSDGTVQGNNAISFNLTANDVNQINWFNSDEKGLLGGASSAEWSIRPSVQNEAITATNINANRTTRWGSAPIQAVHVGRATMFIQAGARKLRELMYYWDIDGYRASDLTELAEHITGSGIVDMTYQRIPISVVWLLRTDGALVGMTYDRDMTQLRTGWHWHVLGGASDSVGTPPVIESIAVIPDPLGVKEDLWMIVKRWINGQVVRTVEYLAKIVEPADQLLQYAVFSDCSSTYDNPITASSVTITNLAATVVAPGHGLSTNDQVRLDAVVGCLNASGVSLVNARRFTITVLDANTFTLNGLTNPTTVTSLYGAQVRKLVTTISGLTYLEGETVSIYADGAVQPPVVVSNTGQITLAVPAATVVIGYGYNSDGQLLRAEAGSRNGTSIGKTRRIHRAGFMLYRSQGLQVGPNFSALDPIEFRTQGVDLNGQAPALFTGIATHEMEFDYDFENQIAFRVSQPVPCTLLSIMPQMQTQDRA